MDYSADRIAVQKGSSTFPRGMEPLSRTSGRPVSVDLPTIVSRRELPKALLPKQERRKSYQPVITTPFTLKPNRLSTIAPPSRENLKVSTYRRSSVGDPSLLRPSEFSLTTKEQPKDYLTLNGSTLKTHNGICDDKTKSEQTEQQPDDQKIVNGFSLKEQSRVNEDQSAEENTVDNGSGSGFQRNAKREMTNSTSIQSVMYETVETAPRATVLNSTNCAALTSASESCKKEIQETRPFKTPLEHLEEEHRSDRYPVNGSIEHINNVSCASYPVIEFSTSKESNSCLSEEVRLTNGGASLVEESPEMNKSTGGNSPASPAKKQVDKSIQSVAVTSPAKIYRSVATISFCKTPAVQKQIENEISSSKLKLSFPVSMETSKYTAENSCDMTLQQQHDERDRTPPRLPDGPPPPLPLLPKTSPPDFAFTSSPLTIITADDTMAESDRSSSIHTTDSSFQYENETTDSGISKVDSSLDNDVEEEQRFSCGSLRKDCIKYSSNEGLSEERDSVLSTPDPSVEQFSPTSSEADSGIVRLRKETNQHEKGHTTAVTATAADIAFTCHDDVLSPGRVCHSSPYVEKQAEVVTTSCKTKSLTSEQISVVSKSSTFLSPVPHTKPVGVINKEAEIVTLLCKTKSLNPEPNPANSMPSPHTRAVNAVNNEKKFQKSVCDMNDVVHDRKVEICCSQQRAIDTSTSKNGTADVKADTDITVNNLKRQNVCQEGGISCRSFLRSAVTTEQIPCSITPVVEHPAEGMQSMEVAIEKGPLGLGFCIEGGKDSPLGDKPISVKRIFRGGSSVQGVLFVGDEILAINGVSVAKMSHYSVWNMLKSVPDGKIQLKIRRNKI